MENNEPHLYPGFFYLFPAMTGAEKNNLQWLYDPMSNEHNDVGLLNKTSRMFVAYHSRMPIMTPHYFDEGFKASPSLDFFFQHMNPGDARLINRLIDAMGHFLNTLPPTERAAYRITIDCCQQSGPRNYIRMMGHAIYDSFTDAPDNAYYRFYLHQICPQTHYTPARYAFCHLPGYRSIRLSDQLPLIPGFSDIKLRHILWISGGKTFKEIARLMNCSENTVRNTLTTCYKKLDLCSCSQYLHYIRCLRLL